MPSNDSALEGKPVISRSRTTFLAQTGLIAALSATFSLVTMWAFSYLAWGPIQFRISEALTVLPLFFPAAIPGLTLGVFIANLLNIGAMGAMGWLDVIFGSLATLLGAVWTYRFRQRRIFALLGPVISNALIVPAYLPIILRGLGFYQIPFTDISLESGYMMMYLFGVVCVGLGQAAVVYGVGMPLATIIHRSRTSSSLKG